MKEFHFVGCVEVRELLGRRANDVEKLVDILEDVPIDSVYYHMHSYFLRHYYLPGTYPNDFANWVAIQVRDRVLGEKLAAITPAGERSLEDVRQDLIEIIYSHLSESKSVSYVVYGETFHFMKSRVIDIPTGIVVHNLHEFMEALKIVDASAIYNHTFETRLRDKKGRSDFAIWLNETLGEKELAERFERLDAYMYSLEGLRNKLIEICAEKGHL